MKNGTTQLVKSKARLSNAVSLRARNFIPFPIASALRKGRSIWLIPCIALICVALPIAAQTNMSFQYFYDDLGQLTKVVDSTGTIIEYIYDPVGNILQIRRSAVAAGSLAIFNFTPQRGGPGQSVTIQGQGFDATPANDIVQFNGTAAGVVSASPTNLSVTVPQGATTGPITVTVAGQTATSGINFTVLPVPVITSLSRKSALLGASFPNARFPGLTVTGINLADSTFALAPATSPPAATFGPPAIDPTGTTATMSLTVGPSATGTFALVATSTAGSSSAVPTKANRFTIVDPRSTADTDGDGVPDAVEAVFGTDPLDPTSFPLIPSLPGQAQSPPFTVLNQSAHARPTLVEAESPAFVVLNTNVPTKTFEAESPAFTLLNANSAQTSHEAESPPFTLLNSNAGMKSFEAESPAFTLLNGSSGQVSHEAESPAFTLLNGTPSQTSHEAESPAFTLKNTAIKAGLQPSSTVGGRAAVSASRTQLKTRGPRKATLQKTGPGNGKPATSGPVTTAEPAQTGRPSSPASDKNSAESSSQQGATHANPNR